MTRVDYIPVVIQAVASDDYKVYAYFDDGSIKCLDMSERLDKEIFLPLRDIGVFKNTLTVLNDTVAWDLTGRHDPADCIDIDPLTVYEQPEAREVDFLPCVS
ncbi:DUF2442 domain-containing protein [Anaerotruncus rubiinfantis]|uniref:DUF2442 domain-containing protein n=1 Tax=Anaerotruncus rubiinfantis TaxID=1720200 RepID=UPI000830490D|nr:DUF2442 domain-containing protein [Anaerotruncus rubiinfantis]